MKILNLYAGIGGNRKLWESVEVTAIEYDVKIAEAYKDLYPNDEVIVTDAHAYLEDNYKNYDVIWSSPPCQTHSSFRQNIGVRYRGVKAVYPDMKLWQEIIFLKANCNVPWVVENVKPYYPSLIEPTIDLQRHYFWSNKPIELKQFPKDNLRAAQIPDLEKLHGFDLSKYQIPNKRQVLRNCVAPELGKYVLNEITRHAV